MAIKQFLIAAAIAVTTPFAASAATLDTGSYDLVDYNGSRSVWTNQGNASNRLIANANHLWSFSNSSFAFNETIGKATLTAKATNLSVPSLMFDVNLDFDYTNTGGQPPYCPGSCGSAPTSTWDYFTMTSGAFTGIGNLAGLVWDITSNPNHLPQVGVGANGLQVNKPDVGFSMWFTFVKTGMLIDDSWNTAGYVFNDAGNGDINSDLGDVNGGPIPTPLPAGAFLLLGGLGGLSMMRRKKRNAA